MRQKLCRRLEDLEKISSSARRARSGDSASGIAYIRAVLDANDFHQEPKESLRDTVARFIGISPRELDQELEEIASGRRRVTA
jgi:hypothetical protein